MLKHYLETVYRRPIAHAGATSSVVIRGERLPATSRCGAYPSQCENELERFASDTFTLRSSADGRMFHKFNDKLEARIDRICSNGEAVTIHSKVQPHPMLSEWQLRIDSVVRGDELVSKTTQTYVRDDYRQQYGSAVIARTRATLPRADQNLAGGIYHPVQAEAAAAR